MNAAPWCRVVSNGWTGCLRWWPRAGGQGHSPSRSPADVRGRGRAQPSPLAIGPAGAGLSVATVADVQPVDVRSDGLIGWFVPGHSPPGPAIVALGGSEGGCPLYL